jgi:hypothetical protein
MGNGSLSFSVCPDTLKGQIMTEASINNNPLIIPFRVGINLALKNMMLSE